MQGKAGWWIAGICAVVVFVSIGYGMGRKSALNSSQVTNSLEPAGAPLSSSIQIEPIQPQQELASIGKTQTQGTANTQKQFADGSAVEQAADPLQVAVPQLSSDKPDNSPEGIRQIQQALKVAGYDPGPADGRMGGRTKTAIRDFQTANGLQADGKVGPRTWSKLQVAASGSTTTSTSTEQR